MKGHIIKVKVEYQGYISHEMVISGGGGGGGGGGALVFHKHILFNTAMILLPKGRSCLRMFR